MALALPIYGALLGLICAAVSVMTGDLGVLGAVAVYSGIGVLSVIGGAVLISLRDETNETPGPKRRPIALAINR